MIKAGPKPQKACGQPKIRKTYVDGTPWTCFLKADGEFTRGWGVTPNDALADWLKKTIAAEESSQARREYFHRASNEVECRFCGALGPAGLDQRDPPAGRCLHR